MFTTDEVDKGFWIERLVASGKYSRKELEEKSNAFWKKRCKRYMSPIGDAEAKRKLLDELDKVLREYTVKRDGNGNYLFTSDTMAKFDSMKAMIDDDILGDPLGELLYYDTNPDAAEPTFITARGSSQLENFWRLLERVCTGAWLCVVEW